jgi:hypothetical protein
MSAQNNSHEGFKIDAVAGGHIDICVSVSSSGVTFSTSGFNDLVLDMVQARDFLILLERSTRTGIPSVSTSVLLTLVKSDGTAAQGIPATNPDFVSSLRRACSVRSAS